VTDIQQARDVLAKWRATKVELRLEFHAPLIAGTAGNPKMLDALDRMLAEFDGDTFVSSDLRHHAECIAASILSVEAQTTQ
jgi:hypothetical protein